MAICLVDDGVTPGVDHDTAPFVYARLKNSRAEEPAGYPPTELDAWANQVQRWTTGSRRARLSCSSS